MKSRFLALLFILVLSLALLCSCKHKHEFATEYSSDDVYHWHACAGCDDKADFEQHDWNSGVVTLKPTADSEGERTYTCNVCRATKIEKLDKLSADHTHVYNIDCSDANGHWNECYCGEKDTVSAHEWDDGVVTKKPTVNADGEKTYTCTVCDYKKVEVIEALGANHTHTYDEKVNDEYNHWNECICGAKSGLTAHTWNSGTTSGGVTTYTCTGCGQKRTEATASANGMSFLQSTHYRMTDRLAKNPLTLEAEILLPTTVTGRGGAIFSNYMGIRQDWHFEIFENGVPRFWYNDASGGTKDFKFTDVKVNTGEWVRIAFTFDYQNGKMSLYVDGVLKQTIDCLYDLAPDATRYKFLVGGDGRSDNSQYFKGQIRSIAAYSDVRTADEIAASAANGTNVYADDLLVAYQLDENSGKSDIIDLSPNGYDIAKEWLDSHTPDINYAYSFAVVGDTQWLSKYKPAKLEGIYDWILANKDSKKIAHVFGLGDITEDWNTANKEQEWIRVHQYISKLDGKLSYSLVRGNHDESKYFEKYFATDTYMSQFDGFMNGDDICNSYKLVTIGQTKYLFMTLDFGAGDEMLDWANEVVLAHPDYRVIVTTHGYQAFDGTPINNDNVTSYGGTASSNDVDTSVGDNKDRTYNTGEQIWEKFVSRHPNIFLLMCGHTSEEDILLLQTEGKHGNVVNQMLIDPQWMDPQKDGVGMVAMLYFSEDGSQMAVEWISTDQENYYNKYYKEYNQFTLDLTDSFNAPAHAFANAYNEDYHYMACACGYTYGEEAHDYDGGVPTPDGYIVYSCDCGYQRIASATDDPIALALQALLEKYYFGGAYYKELSSVTTFYTTDKFWTTDDTNYKNTADYLTLRDIILGRYGDLKLDQGWNVLNGVYSSANEDTINGLMQFAGIDSEIDKVTVEESGAYALIKFYLEDSVYAETKIGAYATTTLVTHAGETLDVLYTKVGENYMCNITTPSFSGYVAEYDKITLDSRHSELDKTVYYSTVSVWDGISASSSLKGEGTAADPYLVESGADLKYIANEVNKLAAKGMAFSGKYFKLTQSIDLAGHELNIGSDSIWATRQIFGGFFDGNHCTIRNLNNSKSLFACVEGGWLKNLSVYGKVNGAGTVGGIVGYVANSGVLENLTSYVTVTGTDTLGGIVGNSENNASTVLNCVNYGNVTGSSWNVGGIAGSGGHDLTGCVNFGNVYSSGSDNIGGIAGTTKSTGSISRCYNYGTVGTAKGRAGGIVGLGTKKIINCVNYGNVNAGWCVGGILGFVNAGETVTITNCVNFGTVSGNTGIGGILGESAAASADKAAAIVNVNGCTNNGKVTGTWGVGGISGNISVNSVLENCVNNARLTANGELGGIVGKCWGKVTKCTNNGEVAGTQDIIGGIVGNLHDTTHINVINTTNYQEGTVTGPNSKPIIGKQ